MLIRLSAGWSVLCVKGNGRGRLRFWTTTRSSVLLPWFAVTRRKAAPFGLYALCPKRLETTARATRRAGDGSGFVAPPRPQAVAEKMWCVPELNEEYLRKMEDVLETYERPYNPDEPVVCLDKKPVVLDADVRPPSPVEPGQEACRDNEYEHHGTANVFCAVEPKNGRHFTFPTVDRSAFEFARVAVE